MTRTLIFTALLLSATSAVCQPPSSRGEFATNSNGLMYSDADMKSLRFIVDSLNLRFKTCDLTKTFYSNAQTKVYHIVFSSEKNNLKDIIKEISNNPDFNSLAKMYSSYIESKDTSELLIRSKNNYDKTYYLQGTPAKGYESVYELSEKEGFTGSNIKNSWFYDYTEKGEYYSKYNLTCFYFPEDWRTISIPEKYGRLIQYVDCMIDTSAVVFLTDKADSRFRERSRDYLKINEYINNAMKLEKKDKEDWEFDYISPSKIEFAKENLTTDDFFKNLLHTVAENELKKNSGSDELEELIGSLVSKEKALLIKRSRIVTGQCSMDQSPRVHAKNIAILAAEVHSWDIFLRAHLDIMNDRFERATDGSYAWGERKTYLKELEELNLNIVDLMLGLTLRADNVANNHYYGTIWRMGWALTESKEKNVFEEKAITMMKDNSLDEFNRGLIFLLYNTYISYLDEKEGKQKIEELRNAIEYFPEFIQTSIKKIATPKKRERR